MPRENEWFTPDRLASLRNVYLAVFGGIFFLPLAAGAAYLVLIADDAILLGLGTGGLALIVLLVGFLVWYNRAFERSAAYRLADEEIQYRRGVWIKKESAVPYRRITNVTTGQGPIQRWVGAGSVQIQTAGQSGQAGAEMTVSGVPEYEEINDLIMERVRGARSDEDEGGATSTMSIGTADEDDLLAEVRRIRELLEERA